VTSVHKVKGVSAEQGSPQRNHRCTAHRKAQSTRGVCPTLSSLQPKTIVLRDEGEAYARKLWGGRRCASPAPAYIGTIHDFVMLNTIADAPAAARAAIAQANAALRSALEMSASRRVGSCAPCGPDRPSRISRWVIAFPMTDLRIRIDDRGAHPREQLALMVTSDRRAALRVRWDVLHSRFRLFSFLRFYCAGTRVIFAANVL